MNVHDCATYSNKNLETCVESLPPPPDGLPFTAGIPTARMKVFFTGINNSRWTRRFSAISLVGARSMVYSLLAADRLAHQDFSNSSGIASNGIDVRSQFFRYFIELDN